MNSAAKIIIRQWKQAGTFWPTAGLWPWDSVWAVQNSPCDIDSDALHQEDGKTTIWPRSVSGSVILLIRWSVFAAEVPNCEAPVLILTRGQSYYLACHFCRNITWPTIRCVMSPCDCFCIIYDGLFSCCCFLFVFIVFLCVSCLDSLWLQEHNFLHPGYPTQHPT